MPKRSTNKGHIIQKWIVPSKDEHGQWWWGYQKVRINILPEEEKLAWLQSMGYGTNERKDDSGKKGNT
jgi:hypothetical protein